MTSHNYDTLADGTTPALTNPTTWSEAAEFAKEFGADAKTPWLVKFEYTMGDEETPRTCTTITETLRGSSIDDKAGVIPLEGDARHSVHVEDIRVLAPLHDHETGELLPKGLTADEVWNRISVEALMSVNDLTTDGVSADEPAAE